MHKLLIAGLTLLILSGCRASTIALSPQDSTTIRGKTGTMSKYARPSFYVITAGKGVFSSLTGGILGPLLIVGPAIHAGNRLVQENDVEDPAHNIAKELGKHLERRYGVLVNSRTSAVCRKDSLDMLISTYGNSGLLLDVKTFDWGISWTVSGWNDYFISYSARLRLIDTKSKRVLAQAVCTKPGQLQLSVDGPLSSLRFNSEHLSYEYLTANRARGLKDRLLEASRYCVDSFLSEAFPETDP